MILEPSTMIFKVYAPKNPYLDFFSKIIHFYWVDTEKHGFLYDRIILGPSNYDFWTLSKMMIFSKMIVFEESNDFEKTQDFRKNSRKSTFFENVNCFRKNQLFSKKSDFAMLWYSVLHLKSTPDRCPCVKRILRKKLNEIKHTNTTNDRVVEEIWLPQKPRNHKFSKKSTFFEKLRFCYVVALNSAP